MSLPSSKLDYKVPTNKDVRLVLVSLSVMKDISIKTLKPEAVGRIFSRVRPFYERAVSNLNMSMHIPLGV